LVRHVNDVTIPPDVRLKDVTADNWEAVADLALADAQKDRVSSNRDSLAESKLNPLARPRAVYAGQLLVGFLMYEPLEAYGKADEALIYRLMIDKRHQGKGYGRAALARAIEEIRQNPRIRKIRICYTPDNPVKKLYASFGFVEVGRDEDGETIAELAT
jgi:diamine N-acetyltransferase